MRTSFMLACLAICLFVRSSLILLALFSFDCITVILSSRRREKLEEVARHCQEEVSSTSATTTSTTTIKVTILPYDAADPSTSESIVEQALQASTPNPFIDVVFLNAGIFQSQPARATSRDERERLWRVNFQSPVDMVSHLVQRNGTSHVVVTASVMAHGPHALSSTYAATKAALRNYFHTLALEEAVYYHQDDHDEKKTKNGMLRINVALPGLTDTSMWLALGDHGKDGAAAVIVPTTGAAAMTPRRVARLIFTGAMLGRPHFLFDELWIGKAPALLWVWMAHYMPVMHHAVVCYLLAYIRIPVWIHERVDVMDVPMLLHRLFLLLLGRYP
jgi:NAD(P)-dependent dehydrogenase (short-subunit alcohol dehydrogenase family)